MRFHIVTTLVDNAGNSPTTGFVNLYRRQDGSLITGKKVYASEADAQRKARPAQGWSRVKTVSVADYQAQIPLIEAAARQAAVKAADLWLSGGTLAPVVPESAIVPQENSDPEAAKPVKKAKKKVTKKPAKKVAAKKRK